MDIRMLISKWRNAPVYAVKYTQDNGEEVAEHFPDIHWDAESKELKLRHSTGATTISRNHWIVWEGSDERREEPAVFVEKDLFNNYSYDPNFVIPKAAPKRENLPGILKMHARWLEKDVYAAKYSLKNGLEIAERFDDLVWDDVREELHWSGGVMDDRSVLKPGTWIVWPIDYEAGDSPTTFSEYRLFSNFTYISGKPVPKILQKPEGLTARYASRWDPNRIVEAVHFTNASRGSEIGRYWSNVAYNDENNTLILNGRDLHASAEKVGAWFISEVGGDICYATNEEQFLQSYGRVPAGEGWAYDLNYRHYVRTDEHGVKHVLERDELLSEE